MGWLTADLVTALVVVVSALVGVWWHVHSSVASLRREFYDYKVYAAEKYVHADHLTKSEERMLKQMDRMCNSIDKLREDLEVLMRSIKGGG